MEEKEKLHTSFEGDAVHVGERGRIRWPLWTSLAVCLPLLGSLIVFAILTFASHGIVTGSLTLLHVHGPKADLWLGYSGACAQAHNSTVTCSLSFLNAYYLKTLASINLGDLEPSIPQNLGYESVLLLVGLIAMALGCVFILWGAVDYYRAEEWQYEGRRGWVAEWIISRRLDLLGSAFAMIGIACALYCASSTAVRLNSAAQAISVLAKKTASDFEAAQTGKGTTALFVAALMAGAAIVIQLLVVAFDGLGHRIRSDYEDLVDDVQQLENESWVALEAKMHTLHELAARHNKATGMLNPERRERARQALENYLVASGAAVLVEDMRLSVEKHKVELKQLAEQARGLNPADPAAPPAFRADDAPLRPNSVSDMLARVETRQRGQSVSDESSWTATLPSLPPLRTLPARPMPSTATAVPPIASTEANKAAYMRQAAAAEERLGDGDLPRGFKQMTARQAARPAERAPVADVPLGVALRQAAAADDDPFMPPTSARGRTTFVPAYGSAF